ncbi:MAG: winged helix-turn-helix domain-containing protein [Bacteroidota bacterium]
MTKTSTRKIIILDEDHDPVAYMSGLDPIVADDTVFELIIDRPAYNAYLNRSRIDFPKKEFEVLILLATNPRKVFKREDILRTIWGKNFRHQDSRSLDVHIRMLRKKLGDNFITTIRGVGYKLER